MAISTFGSQFVLDAAGDLWSWGSNQHGQLGHGDTIERQTPTMIEGLKGKNVKEVITGTTGCVACITVNNTCFIWGSCQWLGLGREVTTPTRLDRPIKSISIGFSHALMIDYVDDVYAIGVNIHGELGLGDKKDRTSWTKVYNLTGRVIKVQCGIWRSAILTTTGVFTMGGIHRDQHKRSDFAWVAPQLIKLANVADISMTWDHILALTTSGELYAWGYNNRSQCGVVSRSDPIKKPKRVGGIEDYKILQMSAGSQFSLFRCTMN